MQENEAQTRSAVKRPDNKYQNEPKWKQWKAISKVRKKSDRACQIVMKSAAMKEANNKNHINFQKKVNPIKWLINRKEE